MKNTTRPSTLFAIALMMVVLPAAGQGSGNKEALVGTWKLVSVVSTLADGTKVNVFGDNALGSVIFGTDGHFNVLFARSGLPKFASGVRIQGTAEEYKAVVEGSLAYAGTYTVESEQSLMFNVNVSTFPAWIGQVQKRKYTLKGEDLQWVGVTGVQGAQILVTLKRAK